MEHSCGTRFPQQVCTLGVSLRADVPLFQVFQVVYNTSTVNRSSFFVNILYWNIWNINKEQLTTRILWHFFVFQLVSFFMEHCGTSWNIINDRWLAPPLESKSVSKLYRALAIRLATYYLLAEDLLNNAIETYLAHSQKEHNHHRIR